MSPAIRANSPASSPRCTEP